MIVDWWLFLIMCFTIQYIEALGPPKMGKFLQITPINVRVYGRYNISGWIIVIHSRENSIWGWLIAVTMAVTPQWSSYNWSKYIKLTNRVKLNQLIKGTPPCSFWLVFVFRIILREVRHSKRCICVVFDHVLLPTNMVGNPHTLSNRSIWTPTGLRPIQWSPS